MPIETQTLAPAIDDAPLAAIERSLTDRAMVLAFGAIGWPWLLRSLGGGSPAMRAALLKRLGLPEDALPALGSWRADASLLTIIADRILATRPRTIVEFGGGTTTLIAARALALNAAAGSPGTLLSFDGEERFAAETRALLATQGLEADVRAAELEPARGDWPGSWYSHGPLPDRIDLLIVDGPPWFLHPYVRGNADIAFDRIAPGGMILLDDAARPGERVVAKRWQNKWRDFDFSYVPGSAGTLVGVRRDN